MVHATALASFVCPSHTISRNGSRYCISFVDAHTRYRWIYFLKLKSEVNSVFQAFYTYVQVQLNHKIKALQTDGGGEFRSLHNFFHTHGIRHRLSCPHTSKQNGVVERKHRHILETGLILLDHASMPLHFWEHAFFTAVFLINRLPTSVLCGDVPFTKLYNQMPDYYILRIFGCLCFPCLQAYNHHKLEFRSQPCTFLGYSDKYKGYKCISSSGRLFISRNVKFTETSFHFAQTCIDDSAISPPSSVSIPLYAPCITSKPLTASSTIHESIPNFSSTSSTSHSSSHIPQNNLSFSRPEDTSSYHL